MKVVLPTSDHIPYFLFNTPKDVIFGSSYHSRQLKIFLITPANRSLVTWMTKPLRLPWLVYVDYIFFCSWFPLALMTIGFDRYLGDKNAPFMHPLRQFLQLRVNQWAILVWAVWSFQWFAIDFMEYPPINSWEVFIREWNPKWFPFKGISIMRWFSQPESSRSRSKSTSIILPIKLPICNSYHLLINITGRSWS